MQKTSAGLLMYKINNELEVFIVHPGGPFWKNRDIGSWSIPKGEADNGEETEEELLQVAKREMEEETGILPSKEKEYFYLGTVRQRNKKVVHAWAFEGNYDLLQCKSFVKMEFPPKSGRFITFPEVDRAGFFSAEKAKEKLNPAQAEFVERLEDYLKEKSLI